MRFDEHYFIETIEKLQSQSYKLNDPKAQKIMGDNIKRFELWPEMVEKGTNNLPNRFIDIYLLDNQPVVYLVHSDNFYNVIKDDDGSLSVNDDDKGNTKTKHLHDIEIAIDKRKELKGVGAEIIKKFINDNKKYDYITLQAHNDFLLNTYYPKLGFKPFEQEDTGNGMYLPTR